MKLISIIIPTFNREIFLKEAISSIIAQTYENWELLIIDDGSVDNSKTVVKNFKDDRIKYFERERLPKGASTCRNIGIQKSTGDYLIFLDSDDLLAHYCLKDRITHFEAQISLDYLVFNGAFFEKKPGDNDVLWNKFTNTDDLTRFYSGDPIWQTTGAIWKRNSIINYKLFFDEKAQSSQDWEFHIKALQKKMIYDTIDSYPDYFVRRSNSQSINAISSKHNSKKFISNRIQLFNTLFKNNESLTKDHKSLLFKYLYFQIFHTHRTFSFLELQVTFKETKKIGLTNSFITSFWFLILTLSLSLNKIGFKKIHIIAYYFSKAYFSKSKSIIHYRYTMDPLFYKELKMKLNEK